jgi:transcriptional regulator with XRE-family HTH domain
VAEIEPEAEFVEVEPPEHALAERLGTVLRQRRVAMGMRQDELALAAGVGRRFIIDLEAGKSSCQLGKAMLVAQALGVKIIDETPRVVGQADIASSGRLKSGDATITGLVDTGPPSQTNDPDLPDDLEEPSP